MRNRRINQAVSTGVEALCIMHIFIDSQCFAPTGVREI